jgi:hypothetical protein
MGADDFNIKTPLNKALFGFGDAVCVPVIDWIAKNYLNPLIDEIHGAHKTAGHAREARGKYAIARYQSPGPISKAR